MATAPPPSRLARLIAGLTPLLNTGVDALAEAWALVAPAECTCGADGALLCPGCNALLDPVRAQRVEHLCDALQLVPGGDGCATEGRGLGREHPRGIPELSFHTPLPVLALGPYSDDLRSLVLGWKNGGRHHLAVPLAAALAPLLDHLVPPGCDVMLVPAPSSWAARARRGEDHVREVALQVAHTRPGTTVAPRIGSISRSQEGRGARARSERTLVHRPWHRTLSAAAPPIVLIDDVVTTGSTLRALARAVADSGGPPVRGAVVVASARWSEETDDERGGPAAA